MTSQFVKMLNDKLDAIAEYENGHQGVLVGENTVLRLPAGFVQITRDDTKAKPRAAIVDLPNATMFSPITVSVIQKDIYDGFGSTPVAMNFRDAIAHERHRINELLSFLKA